MLTYVCLTFTNTWYYAASVILQLPHCSYNRWPEQVGAQKLSLVQ